MQNSPLPPNLRRVEASVYLKQIHGLSCAPSTLAKLACRGGGPTFRKVGAIPLYATADLDNWARSRFSEPLQSTSAFSVRSRRSGSG
jgi:hypothetical protein